MNSTKHREVAKLDRVPLPVEAARIGTTGWQLTRTGGARVLTKLPGRGRWQDKVIKQIPQTFFSDLGPTYVKFGQIIASSPPGAFGENLSREFRGLLDSVPPADTAEVHQLLQQELGGDPAKLFAQFDEEPFASASIAQVHFATLHTGEEVVVKIQRPGIRRRVAADLQILKRFAQLVELAKLGRRLSARDVVADFFRQSRRRARLPHRGAVDGGVGLGSARVAAGPQHPSPAGALGIHQRACADHGTRARRAYR